jgi:hypothetical protein
MLTLATPRYPARHRGPAIVLGSAASAMADLDRALDIHPTAAVMALNFMYRRWPVADHIASADVSFFNRPEVYGDLPYMASYPIKHAACSLRYPKPAAPGADYLWRGMKDGSSGLFGARIARILYDGPVVLAGVPMDRSGYVEGYKPGCHVEGHPGHDLDTMRAAWVASRDRGELAGVTSLGGWTAELLGVPTSGPPA